MYSYGKVEAALAAVHEVRPELRPAFRGRIKKLQGLGIVPASPGKGKRIGYEAKDVYLWAFCLELMEFGIDPHIVERFANTCWNDSALWPVSQVMLDNLDDPKFNYLAKEADIYFTFDPNVLSRWHVEGGKHYGSVSYDVRNAATLGLLFERMGHHRIGLINLSKLRRKVDQALAQS